MLSISEFEIPRSREVTTNCNCKCEVWNDYEEASVYAAKETTSARDFNRTVAGHEPHPIRFDSHER